MTEGPQAKIHALRAARALAGKRVVEVVSKREEFKALSGKTLEQVETVGKNILVIFGEEALRIHLLMFGRLDVCERREECPTDRLRLMLVFEEGALSVSRQASLELGKRDMLERLKITLGPDPLGSWDEEEFLRRLGARGEEKVGTVLLDQTVAAGIGNILRNEILFLSGISPERLVRELSPQEAKLLAEVTLSYTRQYFEALLEGRRERELHSVYMRAKKPCPKCGTPIKMFYQEPHGRKTFYCPSCQK
ncbi:MAG: DNA-formamidopyrimidine glycosylase family protein [Acidilobaceae archaeon]